MTDRTALDRLIGSADPLVAAFAAVFRAQGAENDGAVDEALADLTTATRIADRNGFAWIRLVAGISATQLHSQRADRRTALATAHAARRDLIGLDLGADLTQLDWVLAVNEVATGEVDAAGIRLQQLLAADSGRTGGIDEIRPVVLAALGEVAAARGDGPGALARWDEAVLAGRRSSAPWRVIPAAGALAARMRLEPDADPPLGAYRHLRSVLLALPRIPGDRLDAPVFGAGLLGLAAVLLRPAAAPAERAAGAALVACAESVSARRDLPTIDAVPALADGVRARPIARAEAVARAIEVLQGDARI